ncbi:MAG TPA: MATE family efflux transporter, partial [Acidimicrobiales bacterium]|nr:MATE family efflux transporter [Acidimicrobiales bacterium]
LAYGTTGTVARLIGAGNEREAAHQAVQGMWLALCIAAVLVPGGLLAGGWLVRALGASGALATNAEIYLRISMLGVPALLVTLAGTGYLRGRQDTLTPLAVALGSNVVNLALELVLINGLGFGIGASALATVVAQNAAAAVYVRRVVRAVRTLDVGIRPDRRSIGVLGRAGGALLLRTAALRGALTAATAMATRIGSVDVAAHEIAYELWNFLALALDAVAIAGQAIIGKELGAGSDEEAKAMGRRMLGIGLLSGAVLGALVLALRTVLPHVFSGDEAVIALASFLLWYVALLQPVNGLVFVLDGVLIGAGDLRYMAGAMVGAAAVFAAGAVVVMRLGLGIGWVWALIGAFMVARLVGLGGRFLTGNWAVPGATR